jgi:hypothetical protein
MHGDIVCRLSPCWVLEKRLTWNDDSLPAELHFFDRKEVLEAISNASLVLALHSNSSAVEKYHP